MANKKPIKTSEARIMIFLNNSADQLKFTTNIARKLNIDYAYCLRIIKQMLDKEWLKKIERANKIFYELTDIAPLEKAMQLIIEVNQ